MMDNRPTMQRRRFFRALLEEIAAVSGEVRGTPHFRLAELSEYSVDRLARIRPVIVPDVEIIDREHDILASKGGADGIMVLFERDPMKLFIFNQLNGHATIGDIAMTLAERCACSYESAFVIVRDFFLHLVQSGISVPKNPEATQVSSKEARPRGRRS